jgi:signal transduction histidine kinase/CheY-like chemotaxis protein
VKKTIQRERKTVDQLLKSSALNSLFFSVGVSVIGTLSWRAIEGWREDSFNRRLVQELILRDATDLVTSANLGNIDGALFQLREGLKNLPVMCMRVLIRDTYYSVTWPPESCGLNNDRLLTFDSFEVRSGELSFGQVEFFLKQRQIDMTATGSLMIVIFGITAVLATTWRISLRTLRKAVLDPFRDLTHSLSTQAPNAVSIDACLEVYLLSKAIENFRFKIEQTIRDTAIARTTQSLAHDVRRPFTMFKMIIDAVEGEDDPLEAKQFLKESLPEVQQAMASVNGMIADVLEIGSESSPMTEASNPETLVDATLKEVFRVYPDSQVSITYEMNHEHKVSVDTLKIARVFSNIVGNAVQAMNYKGALWFKTTEIEEDGKVFIRFCLGNGGSFIPASHLPKLFEAFFTLGKKGGTGLGLAIAQKIVMAHGGRIWCESDEKKGVEFFFTLPRSFEKTDMRVQPLPTSSAEISNTFEHARRLSQPGMRACTDPHEVTLEKEIIRLAQAGKKPVSILIVDDEGVYRNSLAALVNRSEELKQHMHLALAVNSMQALEASKASPALVILDVDLGDNSISGYEVLKRLRLGGFKGVVCIHSNRSLPKDYKAAIEAGADAVLPKPMSRPHFLKLALQAAERLLEHGPILNVEPPSLPEFAVVDDSTLVLMAWKRKSKGQAVVHTFESPEAFRAARAEDTAFLARLSLVVTDFYFAQGVTETGLSFGQELKTYFQNPVLLSSDGEFSTSDLAGCVDCVISKVPVSWSELAIHSAERRK